MRRLVTIRWIGFHALTVGCVGLFVVLGHWQWDVGGTHRGTLRNYAYGLEWWVFALILLVLWWRLLRKELNGEPKAGGRAGATAYPQAPRFRVPAPQVTPEVDDTVDPAMAAYNRYLHSLHQEDLATRGRHGRR